MRPAQSAVVDIQRNNGLGRAFGVAILFMGGLYTIAAILIGMV
jgi:hypothetical protein